MPLLHQSLWSLTFDYEFRAYACLNGAVVRRDVLDTTLCDKVCQWLATGQWFSLGTSVSSTNKTDSQNITEILLKVALNTITIMASKNISTYRKIDHNCIANLNETRRYKWRSNQRNCKKYIIQIYLLFTNSTRHRTEQFLEPLYIRSSTRVRIFFHVHKNYLWWYLNYRVNATSTLCLNIMQNYAK